MASGYLSSVDRSTPPPSQVRVLSSSLPWRRSQRGGGPLLVGALCKREILPPSGATGAPFPGDAHLVLVQTVPSVAAPPPSSTFPFTDLLPSPPSLSHLLTCSLHPQGKIRRPKVPASPPPPPRRRRRNRAGAGWCLADSNGRLLCWLFFAASYL